MGGVLDVRSGGRAAPRAVLCGVPPYESSPTPDALNAWYRAVRRTLASLPQCASGFERFVERRCEVEFQDLLTPDKCADEEGFVDDVLLPRTVRAVNRQ